jgi:hypothetical protein
MIHYVRFVRVLLGVICVGAAGGVFASAAEVLVLYGGRQDITWSGVLGFILLFVAWRLCAGMGSPYDE